MIAFFSLVAISPSGFLRDPLGEVALALGIAALAGSLFAWARQTTLPAYLLAGAVAGPAGLGLIGKTEAMSVFAEIGVLVMLFLVGVKLDLRILSRVGATALAAAVAQVAVTGGLGLAVATMLGLGLVQSIYIAFAVAISSTVIVVTVLGSQKELDSLHGKLSVAVLIVQDIVAMVGLFLLPALGRTDRLAGPWGVLGQSLLRIAAFALVATVAYYVFEPLSVMAARSGETSYVFLAAWMLAIGLGGAALGMGKEAGAFAAGVMVSTTKHGHLAASRLAGVRDFFVPFFFLSLGSQVRLGELGRALPLTLALLGLVLVVKPVVIFGALVGARFGARTSTIAALSMGQTSEFTLLLFGAGAEAGQIDEHVRTAVVLASFSSFIVSIFLASYASRIFNRFEGLLERFARGGGEFDLASEAEAGGKLPRAEVLVFGAGRIGGALIEHLRSRGISYIALDFDPMVVKAMRKRDPRVFFGDAEDPDLMDYIDLDALRIVVSTVRNRAVSRLLIRSLRSKGYRGKIVVTADDEDESSEHGQDGADLVLVPYLDAAEMAAGAICEVLELRPPRLFSDDRNLARSEELPGDPCGR